MIVSAADRDFTIDLPEVDELSEGQLGADIYTDAEQQPSPQSPAARPPIHIPYDLRATRSRCHSQRGSHTGSDRPSPTHFDLHCLSDSSTDLPDRPAPAAGHSARTSERLQSSSDSMDKAAKHGAAPAGGARGRGGKSSDKATKRSLALQEKNRRAQRRFRERQKARVAELEEQVAEVTGRLNSALADKVSLEARCGNLVNCVQTRDGQIESLRASCQQASSGKDEDSLSDNFCDDLTLTVRTDKPLVLTPAQVRGLKREDLVRIYKEYVGELSLCLMELDADGSPSAMERIERLTDESTVLMMRVAITSPAVSKAFAAGDLEDAGASSSAPANQEEKPELWLSVARTLALSKHQRLELTQLRRLFLLKMANIVAQRKDIHQRMLTTVPASVGTRHAAQQYLKASEVMGQLKRNMREEHVLKLDWISTLFKHVFTPVQVARCMVNGYPWSPDTLAIASWVAAEDGDPSAISAITAEGDGMLPPAIAAAAALPGASGMRRSSFESSVRRSSFETSRNSCCSDSSNPGSPSPSPYSVGGLPAMTTAIPSLGVATAACTMSPFSVSPASVLPMAPPPTPMSYTCAMSGPASMPPVTTCASLGLPGLMGSPSMGSLQSYAPPDDFLPLMGLAL